MSSEVQVYALPLLVAGLAMLALAAPAWRARREPVVAWFITACVSSAAWPLALAAELMVTSLEWKILLVRVRPLPITLTVSAFVLLVLHFTGRPEAIRRRAWRFLALGMAVVIGLVAAPTEWRIYRFGFVASARPPYRLVWEVGLLEWPFLVWVMGLNMIAVWCLLTSMRGRSRRYRRSVQLLLAGAAAPLLLNAVSKTGPPNWAGINLAPLGSLIAASAWWMALYRYGMLGLAPLGRATVLETMRDMVFILDRGGVVMDCNGAAAAALGGAPATDEPWASVLSDEAITQFTLESRAYTVSRTPILYASRDLAGTVVTLHDVTELIQAREQLQEARRLELVGRLAGGVAHEFNNLLTVILGYTALIRDSGRATPVLLPMVQQIDAAGQKAARLTSQLLSFSRQQMLQPVEVLAGDVVQSMESLLRQMLGEGITFSLTRAADEPIAVVDRRQLEQAVMELAMNARDAMPEGGELAIGIHGSGNELVIAVRDNGEGMDEAALARIFEPFFTTRSLAGHTGLGLAMVQGFAVQSGGRVEVESVPGEGTELRIVLPTRG